MPARCPAIPPMRKSRPIRTEVNIPSGARMLNTKIVSWALGLFTGVTFIVCVLYGLVAPESLHARALLEQMLPAFKWLTWWGFLLGLAESFLYGVYVGLVFCPIYNALNRRWGAASRPH